MLENDICLQGAKNTAFFFQRYAPKKAPMLTISRIGPEFQV